MLYSQNDHMKQIILKVPEKKYAFFIELIKNLGFVKVEHVDEGDAKQKVLDSIEEGFKDMKKYKEGKLKTTSAKDFLRDL